MLLWVIALGFPTGLPNGWYAASLQMKPVVLEFCRTSFVCMTQKQAIITCICAAIFASACCSKCLDRQWIPALASKESFIHAPAATSSLNGHWTDRAVSLLLLTQAPSHFFTSLILFPFSAMGKSIKHLIRLFQQKLLSTLRKWLMKQGLFSLWSRLKGDLIKLLLAAKNYKTNLKRTKAT